MPAATLHADAMVDVAARHCNPFTAGLANFAKQHCRSGKIVLAQQMRTLQ